MIHQWVWMKRAKKVVNVGVDAHWQMGNSWKSSAVQNFLHTCPVMMQHHLLILKSSVFRLFPLKCSFSRRALKMSNRWTQRPPLRPPTSASALIERPRRRPRRASLASFVSSRMIWRWQWVFRSCLVALLNFEAGKTYWKGRLTEREGLLKGKAYWEGRLTEREGLLKGKAHWKGRLTGLLKGKAYWKGRLSSIVLLIKLGCFGYNINKFSLWKAFDMN